MAQQALQKGATQSKLVLAVAFGAAIEGLGRFETSRRGRQARDFVHAQRTRRGGCVRRRRRGEGRAEKSRRG